ncbi:zinc finger, CCHC-type containing protein [Tanacetum coccineum]
MGNGKSTSIWFDSWCSWIPLIRYLTPRDITSEGFNIKSCVADLVANEDLVQWRDLNGALSCFSVGAAWEALRPRGVEVFWYRVVWLSHCTPRHAFHLWLVQLDSHAHLFFECPCSSKAWQLVRPLVGLIMPDSNQTDYKATKQYLPKIHRTHRMLRELRDEYITLEERIFHEGRYVEPSFTEAHKMLLLFRAIGLESFLTLDEQICPRFVTEFYHSFVLKKDPIDKDLSVEFKLGAFTFELTITELLRIFKTLDRGPKTFDEAMKSQDVAFWKEAINDEMDSIMGNNTWVLDDLPLVYRPLGCKWIFKRKLKVDGTVKKFKARLVIQGFKQKSRIDYFDTYATMARISIIRLLISMTSIRNLIIHLMDVKTAFLNGELDEEVYMNQTQGFIIPVNENKVLKKFNYFDCTPVSTPMDTSEKLMPNKGQDVSQLEYSRLIGCLMYAMTCTRHDIAFAVGKLSRYTSNPSTQHWQAIQLVFLLAGGTISWAFKKQTCITGSTKESEFVALAAAGKEAECAAILAKAYSQMYNGKSRHLGVRHNMICELITNGVVSIEFVSSQQNLADHFTKGLTKDLVIKYAEGMGLKSN